MVHDKVISFYEKLVSIESVLAKSGKSKVTALPKAAIMDSDDEFEDELDALYG